MNAAQAPSSESLRTARGMPNAPGPREPGSGWRPFALAIGVHALLLALLFVGVHWQTRKPTAALAELWTPPAPTAPVEPEPRPAAPVKSPEIARPEPKPDPMPENRPDIALERKRERERERERELARERAEQAKKEAEKKQKEEAARKAVEAKKAEDARKVAEAKKAEDARREAEAKKATEARKEQERREAERAKADEQRRQDYVKRMQSSAGTPTDAGGNSSSGGARGAANGGAGGGNEAGYAAKVSSLIRSNTVFQAPPTLQGNPKAEFLVVLTPDCAITSVRLRRSSGVPAWDQAAERAIQRSDPMPRRPEGGCPREMLIEHALRETP